MKLSVFFVIIGHMLVSDLFSEAESACSKYFPIHQILQSPNKVQTFDDTDGFREIKAVQYDVNNCKENSQNPTGKQFAGNYTLIGHESMLTDDECLIKQKDGKMYYNSMQAIVISANGWTFQPTRIDLDDIDAEPGVVSSDGWKESMAIFGMRGSEIIRPSLTFYNRSLLVAQNYTIAQSNLQQMGLSLSGEQLVPGGHYYSDEMVNCPFGRDNIESERCRMSASFSHPIDTLVVMYAVLQKSKTETRAASFISEVVMDCGCRCSQIDVGSRKLLAPIPGVDGECVEKESTAPRTVCDVLGSTWCTKTEVTSYKASGETLPNGNCPCTKSKGYRASVDSPFQPRNDFILNTV